MCDASEADDLMDKEGERGGHNRNVICMCPEAVSINGQGFQMSGSRAQSVPQLLSNQGYQSLIDFLSIVAAVIVAALMFCRGAQIESAA